MTTRTLAVTAIALWVATAAFAGWLFIRGQTVPASDGRAALLLAPQERDLVLAEMRGMLASVQGITAGVAGEDLALVAKAASAAGAAAAQAVPPGLMAKLPLEFKQLGMHTHANFDTIAVAARQGEDPDMILSRLGDQLNNCIACHAMYRIDAALGGRP